MNKATCLGYFGSVLLLSGCSSDYAMTPRLPRALAEVPAPSRSTIETPPRADVFAEWELAAESPWLPYEKLTLPSILSDRPDWVSLPHVEELEEVRLAIRAGERVAADGIPAGTAWFVDLPGAASVAFGHALSREATVSLAIVPTFNNWPTEDEVIPAEQTLAAMIAMPPRPAGDPSNALPVFLLDSWRLVDKEEEFDDDVVDNRYMLSPSDLPSAEVLRAHGIQRVVYLVSSADIASEEDDLNALFASYDEAGIAMYLVDLESLARIEHGLTDLRVEWYVGMRTHFFHVRPRLTVVCDPLFFHRARGGFGTGHFAPIPGGHVHFGFGGGG
jgi:hypothetical protein